MVHTIVDDFGPQVVGIDGSAVVESCLVLVDLVKETAALVKGGGVLTASLLIQILRL